jgi:hypothetical protein
MVLTSYIFIRTFTGRLQQNPQEILIFLGELLSDSSSQGLVLEALAKRTRAQGNTNEDKGAAMLFLLQICR